jgi:hypothetical protein
VPPQVSRTVAVFVAALVPALTPHGCGRQDPDFRGRAAWPKPLPNNCIFTEVGGITADWQGQF